MKRRASFRQKTIVELAIDDEASFRHVALYADLKEVLRRAKYRFRVLPKTASVRWDRALFLNLTFWGSRGGGDVLVDEPIAADVVAHVAWHHLATTAFARDASSEAAPSADALFLGEAIASAFDVYLVGRLLGDAPRSSFLETQVPAMAEATTAAGLSAKGFESLLRGIASDPERAFEDLRQLLVDATSALVACAGAADAMAVLVGFEGHRFASLLHRYELSNWVLYARAYASRALGPDPHVRAFDRALRKKRMPLQWLASEWISPALG